MELCIFLYHCYMRYYFSNEVFLDVFTVVRLLESLRLKKKVLQFQVSMDYASMQRQTKSASCKTSSLVL